MSAASVTVAICTWNRDHLLRQTLEEMTRLAVPAGLVWELLVVNNNCTDDTDGVIAAFADRLPIRRLFESQPGLSHARNRAVAEAAGEYVVWTDDDVLVAPEWLAAYGRAFARHPDAVVFGGPVAPWFPTTPPRWLERAWPRVANAYAAIDYGDTELPLTEGRVPFGANMVMRTRDVRAAGFDPSLGVRPGSRMGGEETDVVRRLLRAGGTGWWVPEARVKHWVAPERQTLAYLDGWYSAYGAYLARHVDESSSPRLFGRPRWLWREALLSEARYRVGRVTRDPSAWMEHFIAARTAWGQLRAHGER